MQLEEPNDEVLQEDLEIIANKENELKDCTVLVTGATGLIGSQIVKALICKNRLKGSNIKVIAFVRNKKKAREIFKHIINNKYLIILDGDIKNKINIKHPVDYIIHGANSTSSKDFVTKPVDVIDTIISGTRNILELAKEKKVKSVLYLSSMEVYGITDENKKYRYFEC